MDQTQESKPNACEICNRRFISNRVLNNHIKTHLATNAKMEEQSGNEFRVSPEKKSPKVPNFHVCKFCRKEFDSPRSLFGHLRHHSAKKSQARPCRDCGKLFRSMKSLVIHSRVHQIRVSDEPTASSSLDFSVKSFNFAENLKWVRRKRSKRISYKIFDSSSSFSSINNDSSVTETDPEVDNVAACLILLSMGVHDLSRLDFRNDGYSDSNSAEFEVETPNQGKKRLWNEVEFPLCGDDDQFLMLKKPRLSALDSQNASMDHKIEQNAEFDPGSRGDEAWLYGIDLKLKSIDLQEDAFDTELVHCSSYSESQTDSRTKNDYKCRTCHRVFTSHRALGGHQTGHRTRKTSVSTKNKNNEGILQNEICESMNDCDAEMLEVAGKSVECELGGYEHRKVRIREHKCLICLKIFGSGKALGGHKKVHHSKRSKTLTGVLDLNLPAMIDDESIGD